MVNLSQTSPAPAFTGEYCHRIEGKNRLTIPADWRFGEEVELFMIPRSFKRCIGVFTRPEIERLKAVATENMTAEKRADFLHKFGRKMQRVVLDKAGRISIPEELRAAFAIVEKVWLTGAVDTFNLWNLADFEAEKARESEDDDVMRSVGI